MILQKHCAITNKPFTISAEEISYYQKFDVPPPKLSPEERALRRMAFANQRQLFLRQCAATGKRIISNYPPEDSTPIFDIEYWYSDKWDMFATGRDYDFSRGFFEQYADLLRVAPRPNLQRAPQFDENSDYTNYAGKNRNCYLIFDSDKNEDCYYSYSLNSCKDVIDCYRLENCELCYECVDCQKCYNSLFLQDCDTCSECYFLKSCIGCAECFGCANLKNKRHCFFNEQLSAEEYKLKLASLNLKSRSALENISARFREFSLQFPQRSMHGVMNEDVIGDYLSQCKNAKYCFDSRKLWDCIHITQGFDSAKDCLDCSEIGDGAELLYECCYMGYSAQNNRFSTHCLGNSSGLTYCYFCPTSSDCFACVGIHHARYCILNKQYTEEEYKALLPKILRHMRSTEEWGEFFPATCSPFPYNITHAYEFFPLTKEEALKRGYRWREEDQKEFAAATAKVTDSAEEIDESVCANVLACGQTGRNYRIQKPELKLYRKLNIPLPALCPDERHRKRHKQRHPRKLHKRECSVSGKSLITTHAPDRSEPLVSEEVFATLLE